MDILENKNSGEADQLEERFHGAMLSLYDNWRSECKFRDKLGRLRPYVALRFRQGVKNSSGLQAARNLLRKRGLSPGFLKLKESGLLHLSVEALVLQPEWKGLFTDQEIAIAQRKLYENGYKG